jgi:hypothetical protein
MRARFWQALIHYLFNLSLLLILSPLLVVFGKDLLTQAKSLYEASDWEGVLGVVPSDAIDPPDLQYYRGMSLARLERWQQAKLAFELGMRLVPRDKKFPQELAGVFFKLGDSRQAKSCLLKTLRIDPEDRYSRDFLASLFLLGGNVEAAIKFWNPGKPLVEDIRIEPPARLNPIISDRAFVCAPSSLLSLNDFRSTEARLKQLNLFPRAIFQLKPLSDGNFDLILHAYERNGLGDNTLEKLFSVFRELPGLALHLDLFNLSGLGRNSETWLRFDPEKLRLLTRFSAPFLSSPTWRYNMYLDARHENWDLSKSYPTETPASGDMLLRRLSAGLEIVNTPGWRWRWKTGVEFSYREFANAPEIQANSQELFFAGSLLNYQISVENTLLRQPERHLRINSYATVNIGNFFAAPQGRFLSTQGGIRAEWCPGSSDQDFVLYSQFRAGKTGGEIPFDELFILGLERDNELWLRGLVATNDRKPGSGLLGRSYLLFNGGCEKRVYHNPLFSVSVGPFLDSGRSYDQNGVFGASSWHWNTGFMIKTRVYNGLTLDIILGRDFQSSRNAFYVTPSN